MPSTTNRSGRLARLTGRTTILVSALFAMTVGGATAAAAATTPEPTVTTVTAMHVIGFDRDVAKANGFEIRTGADNKEYAVAAGDVSPANVVSGNCGFSYVYEYGIGNRAIELYTGFSVVRGRSTTAGACSSTTAAERVTATTAVFSATGRPGRTTGSSAV
jgi:hypothetical protein